VPDAGLYVRRFNVKSLQLRQYAARYRQEHSHKGLCYTNFAVPLTAIVTRSLRFGVSIPKRLFPCSKDSRAMRKRTLEGGLHVVSTVLRGRFHSRRRCAARMLARAAKDPRGRCRIESSVESVLSSSHRLARIGFARAVFTRPTNSRRVGRRESALTSLSDSREASSRGRRGHGRQRSSRCEMIAGRDRRGSCTSDSRNYRRADR